MKKAARMANAIQRAPSVPTPICARTTWIPYIWSAMYGIVATIPVSAISTARKRLSKRSLTESEPVT
jgi:hypothetical protein